MSLSFALHLGVLSTVFLFGCSSPKPVAPQPNASDVAASSVAPESNMAVGSAIYVRENCANCHGDAGEGTKRLGPPLRNLEEHWDRTRLTAFLVDPVSVEALDPRLEEMKSAYWGRMTGYPLAAQELDALIDYLFSMKSEPAPTEG